MPSARVAAAGWAGLGCSEVVLPALYVPFQGHSMPCQTCYSHYASGWSKGRLAQCPLPHRCSAITGTGVLTCPPDSTANPAWAATRAERALCGVRRRLPDGRPTEKVHPGTVKRFTVYPALSCLAATSDHAMPAQLYRQPRCLEFRHCWVWCKQCCVAVVLSLQD